MMQEQPGEQPASGQEVTIYQGQAVESQADQTQERAAEDAA